MRCIIAFLLLCVQIVLPTSIEGSAACSDTGRHAIPVILFTNAGAMTDFHLFQDKVLFDRSMQQRRTFYL
jgi:hypothetical protein